MSKRRRTYEIYAVARGGPFTAKSICFTSGSHPWWYEVRATSIKQAYLLAAREIFAKSARGVGIRKIEYHWWHGAANGPEEAERRGLRILAPYLREEPAGAGS